MPNPIKQKFIEHMELFGLTKETQRGYISGVRCLVNHYHTCLEHLSDDQVRDYFRYLLLKKKLAHSSCKSYLDGITYFYRHICGREVDDRFGLPPHLCGLPSEPEAAQAEIHHSYDDANNYDEKQVGSHGFRPLK